MSIPKPGVKRCRGCQFVKLFAEFHKEPLGKKGLKAICKRCVALGIESTEHIVNAYLLKEQINGYRLCIGCDQTKLLKQFTVKDEPTKTHWPTCISCIQAQRKVKYSKHVRKLIRQYKLSVKYGTCVVGCIASFSDLYLYKYTTKGFFRLKQLKMCRIKAAITPECKVFCREHWKEAELADMKAKALLRSS